MIDDFIKMRTMIENMAQARDNFQNQKKKGEADSKKEEL